MALLSVLDRQHTVVGVLLGYGVETVIHGRQTLRLTRSLIDFRKSRRSSI